MNFSKWSCNFGKLPDLVLASRPKPTFFKYFPIESIFRFSTLEIIFFSFFFQMVNAVTDIQEDTMVEIVLSTAQLGDDDIGKFVYIFLVYFFIYTNFCLLFFQRSNLTL